MLVLDSKRYLRFRSEVYQVPGIASYAHAAAVAVVVVFVYVCHTVVVP